jgi:hypothetical protein
MAGFQVLAKKGDGKKQVVVEKEGRGDGGKREGRGREGEREEGGKEEGGREGRGRGL